MSIADREKLGKQIKAMQSISAQDFTSIWQSSPDLDSATGLMSAVCGLVLAPAVVHAQAAVHRDEGLQLKKLK